MAETLTKAELAARAGIDPDAIDRLCELDILRSGDGNSFVPGDVYRIRLLLSCERAGMKAESVAKALAEDRISLSFMDLPHWRYASLGSKTYEEYAEELNIPVDLMQDIEHAVGIPRPQPGDRIREDDPDVLPIMQGAAAFLDRDALIRTARVYHDALRRISDAESALFDRLVVGGFLRQGMTYREAVDLANQFGAQLSPQQEALIIALYRRVQEHRWTEYWVETVETILDEMGLYERPDRPPAFGFLDLAGYTRLTEERGDEAGARIAADLGHMVDTCAKEHAGQPVKWLGDGVMVFFKQPPDAVRAMIDMVRRAPEVGLPAHAGVAAGPVVEQDGDYFGRTVNMAARIAAYAAAGQTLVSREVADLSAGQGVGFRDIGSVELKGFQKPIPVLEAVMGAGTA